MYITLILTLQLLLHPSICSYTTQFQPIWYQNIITHESRICLLDINNARKIIGLELIASNNTYYTLITWYYSLTSNIPMQFLWFKLDYWKTFAKISWFFFTHSVVICSIMLDSFLANTHVNLNCSHCMLCTILALCLNPVFVWYHFTQCYDNNFF